MFFQSAVAAGDTSQGLWAVLFNLMGPGAAAAAAGSGGGLVPLCALAASLGMPAALEANQELRRVGRAGRGVDRVGRGGGIWRREGADTTWLIAGVALASGMPRAWGGGHVHLAIQAPHQVMVCDGAEGCASATALQLPKHLLVPHVYYTGVGRCGAEAAGSERRPLRPLCPSYARTRHMHTHPRTQCR
jgi:hypothetical protein